MWADQQHGRKQSSYEILLHINIRSKLLQLIDKQMQKDSPSVCFRSYIFYSCTIIVTRKRKYSRKKTFICPQNFYIQCVCEKKCFIAPFQSDGTTGNGVFDDNQYSVKELQAMMTLLHISGLKAV